MCCIPSGCSLSVPQWVYTQCTLARHRLVCVQSGGSNGNNCSNIQLHCRVLLDHLGSRLVQSRQITLRISLYRSVFYLYTISADADLLPHTMLTNHRVTLTLPAWRGTKQRLHVNTTKRITGQNHRLTSSSTSLLAAKRLIDGHQQSECHAWGGFSWGIDVSVSPTVSTMWRSKGEAFCMISDPKQGSLGKMSHGRGPILGHQQVFEIFTVLPRAR